ncbi:MAG: hypothetical protein CR994_05755 [Maribacter sp.]|nr:MAG: hypothetical protein CR994_05755 [Maribacter sp.]
MRVLLVGNSSIYFNNMPAMLETIGHENGIDIKTKLIAFGGYTLEDHLYDGIVDKVLDSVKWDFVVLNEQSTLGSKYVVDGIPRVKENATFYKSIRKFDSKIKRNGARTVIISLYPRRNAPEIDGLLLNYCYMKISNELNSIIVPVSYTWSDVSNAKRDWQLYSEDNLHPTSLGSFVTATVLFSALAGKKSKKFNKMIKGNLIDDFDGFSHRDSLVDLIEIDEPTVSLISKMAFKNVDSLSKSGGYFKVALPD